jgi:SAM-dependent methyltransferase
MTIGGHKVPAFKFRRMIELGRGKKVFLDLMGGVGRGEVPDPDRRIARQSQRIARQSRRIAARSRQLEEYHRQSELLTESVPEKDRKRTLWESGKADEVRWWRDWLERQERKNALGSAGDHKSQLFHLGASGSVLGLPGTVLQERIVEHLSAPHGATVSILDVGAGPMTQLGKRWEGRTVKITAVDPLADEYNRLLDEFGVTPLVRTQPGEVERLTDLFPTNHFDLVHMHNALDHSYDPLTGIRQMLEVVKPGGYVLLEHFFNEAKHASYQGLHQWNLCADDDHFVIWNRETRYSVNNVLDDKAHIRVDRISAENTPNKKRDKLFVSLKKR